MFAKLGVINTVMLIALAAVGAAALNALANRANAPVPMNPNAYEAEREFGK